MAKVVCATRVGNMKDPNPETRGTVDVLDLRSRNWAMTMF